MYCITMIPMDKYINFIYFDGAKIMDLFYASEIYTTSCPGAYLCDTKKYS